MVVFNYSKAETLNDDKSLSFHLGSYSKHIPEKSDQVENFENKLLSVEFKINDYFPLIDLLIVGTIINSSGNRCAMIGAQKTYFDLSNRLSFEGSYVYSGELFFKAFKKCGDDGVYRSIKKKTGLGFAPYIYHGLEYDLTEYISLDTGLLLPNILTMSLQYNF